MRQKQNTMYGLLLLVMTVITSLFYARAEAGERFFDIDHNGYNTVTKGGKVWMKDNLNVSKYRNGDPVRQVESSAEWLAAAAKGEGVWCYYNNDSAKGKTYGRLYNWYAVNDPRGLAPQGWHIATEAEWKGLSRVLAGDPVPVAKKQNATAAWRYPYASVDDVMDFNALQSGLRVSEDDIFNSLGEDAWFWSTSEGSKTHAWAAQFNFDSSFINVSVHDKRDGLAVRCVQD